MKKSFKKILSVLLCAVLLVGSTSVVAFAADGTTDELGSIAEDWMNAMGNLSWNDFNGFVTAILQMFGFKGTYEGVHSIPALMEEWVGWFGPIEQIYDNFINYIGTGDLLKVITNLLGMLG